MKSSESPPGQRGASLLIIVLLLFCLTLALLYTARFHVQEQRIGSHEVRARALLAAAQAGLEHAFVHADALLRDGAPSFDGAGRFELAGPGGTLDEDLRFHTLLHNRGLTPHSAALIEIEAHGSDDRGGRRSIRQQAVLRPWLRHAPPAPLVVRGEVDLPGTIGLGNDDGDVLAWSGGLFLAPGAILDAAVPARCPPDGICAGDARLAAFSAASLAEYFLARSPAQLHALTGGERALHVLGSGDGATRLDSAAFGSDGAPVLLFIDGDLEIDGTVEIDGLLYVNGDWLPGNGTLTVRGAMVVAGTARHRGGALLQYRPSALQALASNGIYARIAGSWTDL
jgi:hypothetical protein